MSTPNKKPKLFGVTDLTISKMLTDVAGSAPTYDVPIPLPGVQSITMENGADEVEGRGDERIMEVEYVDDKSSVSFEVLYTPMEALTVINGGEIDTTTDTNAAEYYGPSPDDEGEYFKIECLTKPRKEKLTMYKVKGRLFPKGLTGKQWNTSTFKGTAIHTTGDVYNGEPRRFSLKQASSAMTVGGTQEVVTLVVAGAITTAGNATVVATTSGMTGSPISLSVGVAVSDSAAVVAQKVREALAANTAVAAVWTVGGAGVNVVLTHILASANDATAKLTIADGTCVGITAAESTITTAGQAAA